MEVVSKLFYNFLICTDKTVFNFLILFLSIILSVEHLELLTSFFKINIQKNRKLLYIIIHLFISIFTKTFISVELHKFIILCFFPLSFYWILKLSCSKVMLFSCIISTIIISVDILIFNIFKILNVNLIIFSKIINILSITIIILIEKQLNSIFKRKKLILNQISNERYSKRAIIIMTLFLLINLSQVLKNSLYVIEKPLYVIVINLCILMCYLFIILENIEIRIDSICEGEQIQFLKANNKMLDLSTENIKKFKNDFINIMQDIGGYIEHNDFEELKIFYAEIMQEYSITNNIALLNPAIINESAIYNLLCTKYYIARKSGIEIRLEVIMDFSKLNIKPYELARILGIFLDNAIEATKKCEHKYIYIAFLSSSNKDIIKIVNTYEADDSLNIEKLFSKGYSTKNSNTGLGLWEVKRILLRHTNVDLYTHKDNNLFYQELSIFSD